MIKNILNFPLAYKLSQKIFLADNFRKKILQKHFKENVGRILDIGCGPGNMVENLSFNEYFGFDTDLNYIEYAKKKYKNCKFFCETFSINSIKKINKVDVVLLFGLLHHLSDEEVSELISTIIHSVRNEFKILILDPVFVENQNPIAKFLIENDRGLFVRNTTGYLKLFSNKNLKFDYKIYDQKIVPYTWIVTEISN
jgi:2-polyprenyl-3-methyl-5-hydroxy-6-metoxy-1,4-benzoquinol methylase